MKKTISGIRGIFGEDLGLADVLEFSNNFSALVASGRCAVGMDTRPTGQMLKDTASAALMRNGISVFDLGVVPTPVVFREAKRYGAGLVITSSHNPVQWNGIKFIVGGRGINEEQLPQIIEHQEILRSGSIGTEEKVSSTSYIEDAAGIIGNITNRPNIAVDIGGGAAKGFAPELLERIGCDVKTINEDMDGCTRGADPTSDQLQELIAASGKREIGFAFDLDGDRLVVVRDGKKQAPDVTLGLGIAKSLDLGYRNFVLSIDTSVAVEKFIRDHGGRSQRSKVGEANVVDLMLKSKAQAGGEGSSGGFILPEFNYCREGILTSGLIASMLGTAEFNEVLGYMEGYQQIREKVYVDSDFHDAVIEETTTELSKECSETILLDGIKGIVDEDSWVLIRRSNTEDIIRISAESNDKERCAKILKNATRLVNQSYDKVR